MDSCMQLSCFVASVITQLIKEDLLIKSLEPIEANSKSPLEYIYNIDLERVSINGFTLCSSDTKSFNCALSVLSSYLDCLTIIYKNKSSSDVMSYSFIHQMGSTIFQSNKFGKKTSKDIIIQFTLSSTRKREPSVSFTKSNDQESSLVQGINGLVNVMANLGKKL
ncbi:uncharacterized protein MONOS_15684 [Monocercomonoides exilis]|uniref:uncharacterized protein n=1 Tax=Monocercomonoides exilis TaxID=2049356 RepID=UPI00355A92DF|nr:hypothetical protein MONOS_15684 [Monocercomonoides exilis]|eukprot:MONOS_15684.1-p1 / transcript=MONOS_15684.1 / gene=MONOS_15684 / organism=Monocercomonoides_exilis_PA203 / gene_product=unspecified product / transcript_product=unspecified product / location=Mono_scaffold01309:6729-7819(+) / protein_length=165 / sequence_SO=supercontig / SO=protein_coding / is_pseudo=false